MIYPNLPKNLYKALLLLGFAALFSACEREEAPAGLTPIIAQIDKTTLSAGDTVELAGRNFGTSREALVVNFNGRVAEVLEAGDIRLRVVVPAGAGSGQLRVIRNERSSNAYPYDYRFRLGREGSVQIATPPSGFNNQRFQIGADGNFYVISGAAPFTISRLSISSNTFEPAASIPPTFGDFVADFFVDASGGIYYTNGSLVEKFGSSNSSISPSLFFSDNFKVDAQGNIYYYRSDDDGSSISTVNINASNGTATFFAPAPSSISDFVLGENNTVWMVENGFVDRLRDSSGPFIVYQSGNNGTLRQVTNFPNLSFGSGRLSFASDINLLCVSSSNNILYLYDIFSTVSYEITMPTEWGLIEGAVIGVGGELYVVSFDFDSGQYFIRRVTLQ